MELKGIVESILFATSKPLSERQIVNLLKKAAKVTPSPETEALAEIKEETIVQTLEAIRNDWETRGIQVQEIAGGYRLTTHPDSAPWVRQLFEEPRAFKLSQPALETLSVIAYRQPVTRAQMEAVRGVSVDGVLDTLVQRGMVREAGRSETPGRPVLYETSPEFLEFFGLRDLDELPNVDELRRIVTKVAEAKAKPETETESPADEHPEAAPADRSAGPESPASAE